MPTQNVYAYWYSSEHAEPNQAGLLRLWVRSWSARGWNPRILTVRNAERHPQYESLRHDYRNLSRLAAESARVSWVCPLEAINFSFTPAQYRKSGPPAPRHFHAAGWESAPVVCFPNVHDMGVIEHCGRPL